MLSQNNSLSQPINPLEAGSSKNNNLESEILPIQQNGQAKGFQPVYVYSNAKNTRKIKPGKSYSQARQDVLILALMDANDDKEIKQRKNLKEGSLRLAKENESEKTNKYFVDLAANDFLKFSNSLLLEQRGWNGLCLEPNPIYWYGLASYRSCTIIGAFVGGPSERDGEEVDVILSNGVFGGILGDDMDNKKEDFVNNKTKEKRNVVSILTVFEETNVPNVIDYFSLDVEGSETLVMQSFPFDSYKIKFMTIERPKEDLVSILNSNGYVKAMNITDWGETLWIHEESTALTVDEIKELVVNKGLKCKWGRGRCVGKLP